MGKLKLETNEIKAPKDSVNVTYSGDLNQSFGQKNCLRLMMLMMQIVALKIQDLHQRRAR